MLILDELLSKIKMNGGMVSMDGISHNKIVYNHIFPHKIQHQ